MIRIFNVVNANLIQIAGLDFTRTTDVAAPSWVFYSASVIGEWTWAGGFYVFNTNGTGWRDWDAAPGGFSWRVDEGSIHVMCWTYYLTDTWDLSIIDANHITIAGWDFTRAEAVFALNPAEQVLVGQWTWDFGHYVFYDNGWGWRDWDASATDFFWHVEGNQVIMHFLIEDQRQYWSLNIVNNDHIVFFGTFHLERTTGVVMPPGLRDRIDADILLGDWLGYVSEIGQLIIRFAQRYRGYMSTEISVFMDLFLSDLDEGYVEEYLWELIIQEIMEYFTDYRDYIIFTEDYFSMLFDWRVMNSNIYFHIPIDGFIESQELQFYGDNILRLDFDGYVIYFERR